MEQRTSLVTPGVADVPASRGFYEALGWRAAASQEDVPVFFQVGGLVVALWGRDQLAADSCTPDGGGWGGVTLAHDVGSPAEVDAVLAEARAAGGRIGRAGAATSWGGYSGVFLDPDGHPREVAHNPFGSITPDGRTLLGP